MKIGVDGYLNTSFLCNTFPMHKTDELQPLLRELEGEKKKNEHDQQQLHPELRKVQQSSVKQEPFSKHFKNLYKRLN